jgi:hypothetical protein
MAAFQYAAKFVRGKTAGDKHRPAVQPLARSTR